MTKNTKTHCKHGHEFTDENSYFNSRGYRECRTCLRGRDRNRKRDTEHARRSALKSRYGVTPEWVDVYTAEVGNRCELCGAPPQKNRLHLDHCHDTGKIRGLLCSKCNAGLHTVEKLGIEAVAAYLIR